jgi:hypothetical protein
LPSGPAAVKGVAVHNLVEARRGREVVGGLVLKQDLCARLEAGLASGKGGELARHAFELHGLHAIFTRSEIIGACQFIARLLARYRTRGPRPPRKHLDVPRPGGLAPFGSEVWIEDADLDLAGRADLVYRAAGGSIHVVDFKSSRAGADAGLLDRYILQLAAYALLVERKMPAAQVVLELATPNGVLEVEVDDRLRRMALSAVASVTQRFPRGLQHVPATLAITGSHCAGCAYRVSCTAYASSLREAGGTLQAYRGYDLAGTVVARDASGAMASVVIRRAAGTACRVDGIPKQAWPDVAVGKDIKAFDVGCREMAMHTGMPANFFVSRPDDLPASSYRAVLHAS